jgi:hypothetical protein
MGLRLQRANANKRASGLPRRLNEYIFSRNRAALRNQTPTSRIELGADSALQRNR